MNKSWTIGLAIAMWLPSFPSLAQNIEEPTEVGTTTMQPGSYSLIQKSTNKAFSLVVTGKGNMILAPETAPPAPAAPAAVVPAVAAPAAVAVPALAVPAAVAPAAPAATAAAGAAIPKSVVSGAAKKLIDKGMQEGMNQLLKSGGTKKFTNLIK